MSNRTKVAEFISAEELKLRVPISPKAERVVQETRQEIENVITGKSDKKIMVIWPCSADFEDSLLEYARKLAELKAKHGDKFVFVMRFYTWKPRTIGGWKWIQQWRLEENGWDEKQTMNEGLLYSRKVAIELMEESWIGLADEMLHPQLHDHFGDVMSYLAIWARSVENQYHREVSSWSNVTIWMKNPTSWNLTVMANSVKAAQSPSPYTMWNDLYQSTWNALAHAILRWWDNWPNFNIESIREAYKIMTQQWIQNPSILIDCSHENCKVDGKKDPLRQFEIMQAVIESIKGESELKAFVKWFMVESYIYDWNQPIPKDIWDAKHWLSLTDPCIWIEATEKWLWEVHALLAA